MHKAKAWISAAPWPLDGTVGLSETLTHPVLQNIYFFLSFWRFPFSPFVLGCVIFGLPSPSSSCKLFVSPLASFTDKMRKGEGGKKPQAEFLNHLHYPTSVITADFPSLSCFSESSCNLQTRPLQPALIDLLLMKTKGHKGAAWDPKRMLALRILRSVTKQYVQ